MSQTHAPKPARPARVPLDGVLLLDKPDGLSSNDALVRAKRLLNAPKAGHTGTLDPFATGLLPLCFGEATKFSQDVLEADKTYEATLHLGVRTETGDTEGVVLQTRPVACTPEQIETVLARFRGCIEQIPPMYSALKRDGKPLYEYARQGITLEREARQVRIHALTALSYHAPFLQIRVICSKGTYIRVLGEDIGAALGCGAHLQALRRTAVGRLNLAQAWTLDALDALPLAERRACVAPVDTLLSTLPPVYLPDAAAGRFCNGQRLALARLDIPIPPYGTVRVYAQTDGRLLGVAQVHPPGTLAPERVLSLAPHG